VAILGRPQRRGRSRLRGRAIALSLLAAPGIDLCNADIEGSELVIYAFSLFGGPDIYVADSMKVEMSGFSSLVGNELEGSRRPADPDAPVIWVRAYSLLGGCTVWRLPPHLQAVPYRAARRAAKNLRLAPPQTSQADSPSSEPHPRRGGYSWDVTSCRSRPEASTRVTHQRPIRAGTVCKTADYAVGEWAESARPGIPAWAACSERRMPIMMKSFQPSG
jgi:hypothetical protein